MTGLPATEFDTMGELLEKTHGPRARIIEALSFYEGRAHSQQVRKYGEIPSGTYHFDKLEDQGMIERDGTEYVSSGGSAIAYRLTEFGWEVAEEVEGPPDAGADLDDLKEGMNQVISKLNEHTKEIRQLKKEYDRLAASIEQEQAHSGDNRRNRD